MDRARIIDRAMAAAGRAGRRFHFAKGSLAGKEYFLGFLCRALLIERVRTRRLREEVANLSEGMAYLEQEMTIESLELELAMARGIAEEHCPHRLPWEAS